jgi:hypothetical protein
MARPPCSNGGESHLGHSFCCTTTVIRRLRSLPQPVLNLLIALAAVLCIALAWPDLFFHGWVPVNGEVMRFSFPNWAFSAEAFHHGRWPPLWNPFRCMGEPFLADPRSMATYPIYAALGGIQRYGLFLALWVLLHSLLAGFFTARLAFRLFPDRTAACSAAAIVVLNGFFVTHAAYPNVFAAAAWMPAVLYYLYIGSPRKLGAALALQWTAGYPPFFLLSVFAALWPQPGLPRRLATLCRGAGWAAGFAALQWIPFLQLLRHTTRPLLLDAEIAGAFSVPVTQCLKEFLLPQWIRYAPALDGDPAMVLFYTGLPALALALWGSIRKPQLRGWAGLTGIATLLSLGRFLPGYRYLLPLHFFRFPASWLWLTAFGMSVLAAGGIATFRRATTRALMFAVLLTDLIAFAQVSAVAWFPDSFLTQAPPLAEELRRAKYPARIYHTELFKENWLRYGRLSRIEDYRLLKNTLTPSHGMAFGVEDINSYQIWRLKSTEAYLDQLRREGPASPLLPAAGGSFVVTLVSPAANPTERNAIEIVRLPTPASTLYFVHPGARDRFDIVDYQPGKITVGTHSEAAGEFVCAQAYYPGWKAFVDERPAALELHRQIFLKVSVPAGNHRVGFEYDAVLFKWGLVISLLTLVASLRTYRRTGR